MKFSGLATNSRTGRCRRRYGRRRGARDQGEISASALYCQRRSQPKAAPEDAGPITMDDLINMFQNQVDDDDVIARVKRDGITFQPAQEFLDAAGKEGVSKEVLAAIKTAKVKPAVEKPKSPYKKQATKTQGDPAAAFKQAAAVSEGLYGIPVIVHCCLEPHGAVAAWGADDHLEVQISTQNVSGIAGQMAQPLGVPASNIHMRQQNVGGGFGSKFVPIAGASSPPSSPRRPAASR